MPPRFSLTPPIPHGIMLLDRRTALIMGRSQNHQMMIHGVQTMKKYIEAVEKHKDEILAAEDYLWSHPQTGYNEWLAHTYLAERFEKAGYALRCAGDIPGFLTVLDTGRPGPRILVLGELDSLVCFEHPDCDKQTGAVHACGHCAQSAALLGIALALKEPGVLDGLSGSICLCAVPAEELIELEQREALRRKGVIHYFGGKIEFLYRGYFDGCDMAFMLHTSGAPGVRISQGGNGCVLKQIEYIGKAAHAGGAPHMGVNALYAANQGISAANALRETFQDGDHIRFHPIITAGGTVVNAIPARVSMESYVRGASLEAIRKANDSVNRALAASAAAIGAQIHLRDIPGYAPLINDPTLGGILLDAAREIFPENEVAKIEVWDTGCTDMGDLSAVMPAAQPIVGGAEGLGHGADYRIADPVSACVKSAEVQVTALAKLMENDAALASEVLKNAQPRFESRQAYFEAIDAFQLDRDIVSYAENGDVTLKLGR